MKLEEIKKLENVSVREADGFVEISVNGDYRLVDKSNSADERGYNIFSIGSFPYKEDYPDFEVATTDQAKILELEADELEAITQGEYDTEDVEYTEEELDDEDFNQID